MTQILFPGIIEIQIFLKKEAFRKPYNNDYIEKNTNLGIQQRHRRN